MSPMPPGKHSLISKQVKTTITTTTTKQSTVTIMHKEAAAWLGIPHKLGLTIAVETITVQPVAYSTTARVGSNAVVTVMLTLVCHLRTLVNVYKIE